jgi:L-lactate dehydrogenase complex protein LldG
VKRAAFVARVRAALGRQAGDPLPSPPAPAASALVAPSVVGLAGEALLNHFIARSEAVGAPVRRARDEAEGVAVAAAWLRELGDSSVADNHPLSLQALAASGLPSAPAASASVGVTRAWRGIAETGTVVMRSREGRRAALLPPQQLVLLHALEVVPGLSELYADVAGSEPAAALVQITGPSRTADIEMTLVTGVHGPEGVFVVVIGEP